MHALAGSDVGLVRRLRLVVPGGRAAPRRCHPLCIPELAVRQLPALQHVEPAVERGVSRTVGARGRQAGMQRSSSR